jgi:hypothetical protein
MGRLSCQPVHIVSTRRGYIYIEYQTYRSPATGDHKVLGLLVRECYQAAGAEWSVKLLYTTPQLGKASNSLHGCLGDGYPPAVEVLLQSLIELVQSAQLQFSHALLLATACVVCANLIWRGHVGRIKLG